MMTIEMILELLLNLCRKDATIYNLERQLADLRANYEDQAKANVDRQERIVALQAELQQWKDAADESDLEKLGWVSKNRGRGTPV